MTDVDRELLRGSSCLVDQWNYIWKLREIGVRPATEYLYRVVVPCDIADAR